MKNRIEAISIALAVSTFASLATASTYTYTFDDMTWVLDSAKDSFNRSRYWEYRGPDRWGTVWESPLTFASTYPSQTNYQHFHIGFKGTEECYDPNTQATGHYVSGQCVPLNPQVNRGPFATHDGTEGLYFQLVKGDNTAVPFIVTSIDVYNWANESITLFVRKTDGGWFYWTNLHGYLNGTPSYYRWFLSSGYTGKFTAMAWQTITGGGYASAVGRVEITD
jgi:hypothetical protein